MGHRRRGGGPGGSGGDLLVHVHTAAITAHRQNAVGKGGAGNAHTDQTARKHGAARGGQQGANGGAAYNPPMELCQLPVLVCDQHMGFVRRERDV